MMARVKNLKDIQALQAENKNLKSLLEQTTKEHKEQACNSYFILIGILWLTLIPICKASSVEKEHENYL